MKWFIAILCGMVVCHSFAAEPSGSETPQRVFDKFGTAVKKKDYRTAMEQITSDSQDAVLGMLSMDLAVSGMADPKIGEQGDALLKKHNVKKFDMSQFQTPPKDRRAAAREVGANVKDKPTALAEILEFIEKNSSEGKSSPASKGHLIETWTGELTDVRVDGEKATGSLKVKKGDEAEVRPIRFKKNADGWLVDFFNED